MLRLLELTILLSAILSPFFYLASDLTDLDEAKKLGTGVLQAAAIAAVFKAYSIWKDTIYCPKCKKKMKLCTCPD